MAVYVGRSLVDSCGLFEESCARSVRLWDRWKRFRIQGQLVRNFIGRQEARAVCTESACGLFQLNHRISDRFGGKVEILSGCTLAAEGAFQPSGCEQSE